MRIDMQYLLENKTASDILIGDYTLPANAKEVIFDDVAKQYEKSLIAFKELNTTFAKVVSGEIDFYVDETKVDISNGFSEIVLQWQKSIDEAFPIPFLSGKGNCFYDLCNNTLNVYNVIEKKWYSTPMTERVDP